MDERPDSTGIFIRAELPDVGHCSVDIADPALPEQELVNWINSKDKEFLANLVVTLVQGLKERNNAHNQH